MKNKTIYNFLVILSFLFISCGKQKEQKQEDTGHEEISHEELEKTSLEITSFQFKMAGIELGKIEQKGLSETIKASGKIDIPPQNYAEVSTYVGAVVKSILAIEGDFVKKGQTVMVLEHPDLIKLQQEYILAKSNADFLEKEYQRQKELYDEKVSSGKIFQEAETNYNAGKGKLLSLKKQLEMLSISTEALDKGTISSTIQLRAPVEGYIGHIKVSIGAYAEPNKVVFDVINLDDVHLHLSVFEKDVSKIKIGQKVYATVPNQENEPIEAVVFRIGKMIDDNTKAIDIHADIKNKHDGLLPGLFVNAVINIQDKTVSAVPKEAVVRSGEKQYIFIVGSNSISEKTMKNNQFKSDPSTNSIPLNYKMVQVKTRAEALGFIEITPLQQMDEKSQVVIKGAYFLISQLKSGEIEGCCEVKDEKK